MSVSPTGDTPAPDPDLALPAIEELAAPQLRLAGVRINPKTNGPARPPRVTGLTLVAAAGRRTEEARAAGRGAVRVPALVAGRQAVRARRTRRRTGSSCGSARSRPANSGTNASRWRDAQRAPSATRSSGCRIASSLLVQLVADRTGRTRGAPPVRRRAVRPGRAGERRQGRAGPHLPGPAEEPARRGAVRVLRHVASSRSSTAKPENGKPVALVGEPRASCIWIATRRRTANSLLVTRVKKPFSYLLPVSSFPRAVEVWNARRRTSSTRSPTCRCRTRCRSRACRPARGRCGGCRRCRAR